MKSRTKARSLALQALYEIDLVDHKPELVIIDRLLASTLDSDLKEFSQLIIRGVIPMIDNLDRLIAGHAPEWPLDQVAIIDRNILRIALWEFAIFQETPIKVVINEAVELSKVYGSDSTPRFVNGVLGSLANHQYKIQQELKSLVEVLEK